MAAITAAAGVLGAAIPQIPVLIRDIRQAGQDRRERQAAGIRQACLDLLSAAGSLQAEVANAGLCHGAEMDEKLVEIRSCAAAVKLHAASIELLAPATLGPCAERLAREAVRLAELAVEKTDPIAKQMVEVPLPGPLDEAAEAFRERAVAEAGK